MLQADDDVAFKDFDATGEAVFFRVLVPLIEDVEFLVGGRLEIFHAGIDRDSASSAGAVEATGFHFDARLLAGIEEKSSSRDFGALTAGEESNFGHNKKSLREYGSVLPRVELDSTLTEISAK